MEQQWQAGAGRAARVQEEHPGCREDGALPEAQHGGSFTSCPCQDFGYSASQAVVASHSYSTACLLLCCPYYHRCL